METCSAGGAPSTSGSQARKDPGSGLIEVEQKFLLRPSTAEKLVALGAALEGHVTFRDQYYDVPDFRLTLADHWLRQREGTGWELKCPPQPQEGTRVPGCAINLATVKEKPLTPGGDHVDHCQPPQPLESISETDPVTRYLEMTRPSEIVARVCELLGVDPDPRWYEDVAIAIHELGLQEFASFVTQRHRYSLGNLNVDLDEADFGYAVGEVEAMVRHQEDISEALENIQKLGHQLGFDARTRIPGKMSAYLSKFRPAHYNALVQAGRLRKLKDATHGRGGEESS